jgi:hypothetical protein
MTNAGRSTRKAWLGALIAASAVSVFAFAMVAGSALAQDRVAAETLAADALYERVADSTTTDGIAASPTPTISPSPSDTTAAASATLPRSPAGPVTLPAPTADASPAAASSPAADASPIAAAPPAASRTETYVVPDSISAPAFSAQSTTVIPSAAPQTEPARAASAPAADASADDAEIVNYQNWQRDPAFDPHLHSLQEFLSEGSGGTPLGIEIRQARCKLASGQMADGLQIVDVTANSPAAKAGLHSFHRTVSDVLKGVTVAGALFFPPAVILLPIMDQVHVGETSDMIIAVDGTRVTDYIQFAELLRDVRPGEIVYLSIIRGGGRLQVPVHLPQTLPPPTF